MINIVGEPQEGRGKGGGSNSTWQVFQNTQLVMNDTGEKEWRQERKDYCKVNPH